MATKMCCVGMLASGPCLPMGLTCPPPNGCNTQCLAAPRQACAAAADGPHQQACCGMTSTGLSSLLESQQTASPSAAQTQVVPLRLYIEAWCLRAPATGAQDRQARGCGIHSRLRVRSLLSSCKHCLNVSHRSESHGQSQSVAQV
jgi:hypothetical protein